MCSSIPKSDAAVLIGLTTKAAKKSMVELADAVSLGLCLAATSDVVFYCLCTALELSVLKIWLVRPAKESDGKLLTAFPLEIVF